MSNKLKALKDLDDLLCKYKVKDLADLENRFERIADLETKLADLQEEQTKEMQEHQEAMELADKTINNLVEDNRASQEWYKKQLADKDEQLEYFSKRDEEKEKQLEKQAEFHRKSVLELKQQLAKKEEQVRKSQEMYFETLKELDELEDNFNNTSLELWAEKIITQDKISFALEQLEKVKEYALELFKKFCQSTEYHSNKSLVGRRFIEYYPFNDFIDNQIKQLKEME